MFAIGQKVKTIRPTRHGMIPLGSVGTVVEIRTSGITAGVSVEFMRKPEPIIARIFGKNPNVPEPFRCLFPLKSAGKQIAKV